MPRRLHPEPVLDASHPERSDASTVSDKTTPEAGLSVYLHPVAWMALKSAGLREGREGERLAEVLKSRAVLIEWQLSVSSGMAMQCAGCRTTN